MRFNHFVRSKVINPNWNQFNIGNNMEGSLDGTNVKQVGGVWVVGMITKPKNVDVPVQTLIDSNIGIIGGRRSSRRSSHRSSRRRSSRHRSSRRVKK